MPKTEATFTTEFVAWILASILKKNPSATIDDHYISALSSGTLTYCAVQHRLRDVKRLAREFASTDDASGNVGATTNATSAPKTPKRKRTPKKAQTEIAEDDSDTIVAENPAPNTAKKLKHDEQIKAEEDAD